ncbi:UPF0755 protein [Rhodovulum iodosum]|uniref:Endolytic murein transglycosylase n=1 Tax=Rhodovulum iodosum TaxID=68291 RepID=A0ABV3XVD3_9RHOB|nr:endolytic transglycosylase MltG [Rhodovulum robiginosum]RSK33529.1 endolytic transglycosylase MltG [Rhodovulum robiginosum]
MWRAVASNGLTLLVVVLFCGAGLVLWGQRQYTQPGPLEQAICLRVERGATLSRVSEQLAAEGAVTHPAIFRLGADYTGRSGQLKAGSFLVRPGASMDEITAAITQSGRSTCGTELNFRIGIANAEVQVRELNPETERYEVTIEYDPGAEAAPEGYAELAARADLRYRVTLAEGVTSWQVVEELKSAEFLEGAVAELPAEGSLAPDSYEVTRGAEREELIARMQQRQAAILDELWAEREEGLPLDSREEALILASIVEKETGVPQERGQVASVFINRLNQGIRLQTDPTVIYGLTEGRAPLGRGLRQSELRSNTRWNTYVIDGLPPTPIANPGRASIAAALNPDETDFLYFVADGTGGHAFAETLAEHNENVARWREIEAERGGN